MKHKNHSSDLFAKIPSNTTFITVVVIIFGLLGWLFIYLLSSEIGRNNSGYTCSGKITSAKLEKAFTSKGRYSDRSQNYNCIEIVYINGSVKNTQENWSTFGSDPSDLIIECQKRIGVSITGYCKNKEFRKHKNSRESIIGIVFLLGIFILSGKLRYNHYQRKKNINL